MNSGADRIVLDTNVCLDLWVFADPRVRALHAALKAGAVQAVTDTACRDEWHRVLRYPQLRLGDAARRAHADAFDALVIRLPDDADPDQTAARLPRCADPDDQKFLQLALSSGARWLLSRDNDLLALDRRMQRDGLFGIVSPQLWPASAARPAMDAACR